MAAEISLDDKYLANAGPIYLTGNQAIVRLALIQRRRDARAGLNTAGYVTGYRGSPLAGLDRAFQTTGKVLKDHQIRFHPGLNEDLAATALWGTQQLDFVPGANVDGVFGFWYGKGPGVDRSGDPFKHANMAGTHKNGGVLVLFGDDHAARSSTVAHQSEPALLSAMIPSLHPANLQDYLDLGLHGIALSRFAGVWVGMKCLTDVVESAGTVDAGIDRVTIRLPEDFVPPPGGLNIRQNDPWLAQEERLLTHKVAAVRAYARANGLDRVIFAPERARFGIAATGKAYADLREAFEILGLSEAHLKAEGVALYKIAMVWPLEEDGLRGFAAGLDELMIVEEKRCILQDQIALALTKLPHDQQPALTGKWDDRGREILPAHGEMTPLMIARALLSRLEARGIKTLDAAERLAARERAIKHADSNVTRSPFFCSGCPHNTGTRLPDGSIAGGGIGCHTMAVWMPDRETLPVSHMGGEGAAWIGLSSYVDRKHIFQNLGDGTYMHSGLLAVRAAVAAKVNITYRVLYNDAVAMTGGQAHDGTLTVPMIAHQLRAEGIERIEIVSDDPGKYLGSPDFPPGVGFHHRDDYIAVQTMLRDIPGVTVVIYDQTCAAEKRRRRKRGLMVDPPKRVFINSAVCEGCGDCSKQSTCVSILPLETELGRKRQIDQSSCNKDYSCTKGFCPSFVEVEGATPAKPPARVLADAEKTLFTKLTPPETITPAGRPYEMLITGIGGTGVVTIGALLGMAAHLDGRACTVLDITGLAQKNGAVTSHVKIAARAEELHAVRIGPAEGDLLLGCDLMVAGSEQGVSTLGPKARAVVNSHIVPTAAFQFNPDMDFEGPAFMGAIVNAVGAARVTQIDAGKIVTALFGDTQGVNMFMLGVALQAGLLPVSPASLDRAIEMNGVAVNLNKRVLAWGRVAFTDPDAVKKAAGLMPAAISLPQSLDDLIKDRETRLTAYQNAAYAARYRRLVDTVRAAETAALPGSDSLTRTVARYFYKLMAYKDEYEVARLYSDGEFVRSLRQTFDGQPRLSLLLSPPAIAPRDKVTGLPRKMRFGAWIFPALSLLARLKFLRGTALDPFGRTEERRAERALIMQYEADIKTLLSRLTPADQQLAIDIAAIPEHIRGFGHVKERHMREAATLREKLMGQLQRASAVQAAE